MSKITYTDKITGDLFTAADANEIKASVNALYDDVKKGKLNLNEGTTPIVFDTPFLNGTVYMLLINCRDNVGSVEYTISSETITGFSITVAAAATLIYKAEKL